MKRTLLFLFLAIGYYPLYSQEYVPTNEDIQDFLQSKTYVVLEDNPMVEYNFVIEELIPKVWHITSYEFIKYSEINNYIADRRNSFLLLTQVTFNKDKLQARYKFLSLLLGGRGKRLEDLPDLCSVPLSYYDVDEESYIYKLGSMLEFVQQHVRLIHDDPSVISENIFTYYNKNINDIQGKTLYLVKEELEPDINSLSKIKKYYAGNVSFVSKEEIKKAISEKKPDVVFLHKVGPEGTRKKARCYKVLIGSGDARFYYFDYHMINKNNPDGFLSKDLKKLNRQ